MTDPAYARWLEADTVAQAIKALRTIKTAAGIQEFWDRLNGEILPTWQGSAVWLPSLATPTCTEACDEDDA
jgi:hypothetical protein